MAPSYSAIIFKVSCEANEFPAIEKNIWLDLRSYGEEIYLNFNISVNNLIPMLEINGNEFPLSKLIKLPAYYIRPCELW